MFSSAHFSSVGIESALTKTDFLMSVFIFVFLIFVSVFDLLCLHVCVCVCVCVWSGPGEQPFLAHCSFVFVWACMPSPPGPRCKKR